jgi:hypothetical protein
LVIPVSQFARLDPRPGLVLQLDVLVLAMEPDLLLLRYTLHFPLGVLVLLPFAILATVQPINFAHFPLARFLIILLFDFRIAILGLVQTIEKLVAGLHQPGAAQLVDLQENLSQLLPYSRISIGTTNK